MLDTPEQCPHLLRELWLAMDHGGFSAAIRAELLRFNGGLVAVLRQLHDQLNAADAYGWPNRRPEADILQRLVDFNTERAAEEQRDLIRWLRPAFQNPEGQQAEKTGIAVEAAVTVAAKDKLLWPKTLPEQVQALRGLPGGQPLTAGQLAACFKGARRERVEELLQTLTMLGQVRASDAGTYLQG